MSVSWPSLPGVDPFPWAGAAIVLPVALDPGLVFTPAGSVRETSGAGGSGYFGAPLACTTTDGVTVTRLTTGGAPSSTNTLNLLTPNAVMRVTGVMMAKQTAPVPNDSASWDVTFAIRSNGAAVLSLVSGATLGGQTYADASMTAAVFQAIAVDAANGGSNLSVVGVAGATIAWTFFPTLVVVE